MSINYTLSIGNATKKFSVGEFSDVIVDISVGVNAQSEEYPQFTYSCSGQVSFDVDELNVDSFVQFDQINQDILVGWLLAKEGVDTVEEYSLVKYSIQNIQDRIDQLQKEESVGLNYTISNIPPIVEPTEEVMELTPEQLPTSQDEEILNP